MRPCVSASPHLPPERGVDAHEVKLETFADTVAEHAEKLKKIGTSIDEILELIAKHAELHDAGESPA